jgi:hypothetical protein
MADPNARSIRSVVFTAKRKRDKAREAIRIFRFALLHNYFKIGA